MPTVNLHLIMQSGLHKISSICSNEGKCVHLLFLQLDPWPAYIQERIDLFDRLKAQYDEKLAGKETMVYMEQKQIKCEFLQIK